MLDAGIEVTLPVLLWLAALWLALLAGAMWMYARCVLSALWVKMCWYVCACGCVGGSEGSVRGGVSRKRRYVRFHGVVRESVGKRVSSEETRVEAVVVESAGCAVGVGMK